MMPVNENRLRQIYQTVKAQPGLTAAEIARRLNDDRTSVYRALARMDRYGLLLCEDDHGRLQTFN